MTEIKTPVTDHVDFESVYEPAEDTFLLIDALERDLQQLNNVNRPVISVEIGAGSGIVASAIAASIPSTFVFACDINVKAAKASQRTFRVNSVASKAEVVLLDFFQGWSALEGRVDLLVCNPPYVATSEAETEFQDLRASWAGGEAGRNVTDRVIRSLPCLLSEKGLAYVVLEQCNRPKEVETIAQDLNLETEIVLKRRAGRELLSVLKLSRKC